MNFYARYAMEPHNRYTDQDTRNRLTEIRKLLGKDTQGTAFKNFSLDRYMREHICMATNISPTVDVRIEFDEDFLETVLADKYYFGNEVERNFEKAFEWYCMKTVFSSIKITMWQRIGTH